MAQERVRGNSKKKRRDMRRRTRGSDLPAPAKWLGPIYYSYGAYQRFNSNQKQRPSCRFFFWNTVLDRSQRRRAVVEAVGIDTLGSRLRDAAIEARSQIVAPGQLSAWARI